MSATYNIEYHNRQTGERMEFPQVRDEDVRVLEFTFYHHDLISEGWVFVKEVIN